MIFFPRTFALYLLIAATIPLRGMARTQSMVRAAKQALQRNFNAIKRPVVPGHPIQIRNYSKMSSEDARKLLKVPADVTQKDLKAAYMKFAKENHPDVSNKLNATELMKKGNEAFKLLEFELLNNTQKSSSDGMKASSNKSSQTSSNNSSRDSSNSSSSGSSQSSYNNSSRSSSNNSSKNSSTGSSYNYSSNKSSRDSSNSSSSGSSQSSYSDSSPGSSYKSYKSYSESYRKTPLREWLERNEDALKALAGVLAVVAEVTREIRDHYNKPLEKYGKAQQSKRFNEQLRYDEIEPELKNKLNSEKIALAESYITGSITAYDSSSGQDKVFPAEINLERAQKLIDEVFKNNPYDPEIAATTKRLTKKISAQKTIKAFIAGFTKLIENMG